MQDLETLLSGTQAQRSEFFQRYRKMNNGERRQANKKLKENDFIELVRDTYKHVWKKRFSIPELMGIRDIHETIGESIYTALGIDRHHSNELLKKCFEDYGILDSTKSVIVEDFISSRKSISKSTALIDLFFSNKNEKYKENALTYADAYAKKYNKNVADLDDNDFSKLPGKVCDVLRESYGHDIKQVTKKKEYKINSDPSYRVAFIRWNDKLENVLRNLLESAEDKRKFILEHSQLLWDSLGVTSFAALMKAQEIGLIPETFRFGIGEKEGIPNYPLVDFEGYKIKEDLIASIGRFDQIHSHLYRSANHGQNFHANVPIKYKGIKPQDYSEEEFELLSTVAAFIYNPYMFNRQEKEFKDAKSIYLYTAPTDFSVDPRIVPVRLGDDLLGTQIFMPAKDSFTLGAGVDSGVLKTRIDQNIYLFRHDGKGVLVG